MSRPAKRTLHAHHVLIGRNQAPLRQLPPPDPRLGLDRSGADPKRPDESTLWDSKIELSEKFFNEIIRHPVPLDMNTLKALTRSPLGLDLYVWRNYRVF